MTKCVKNAVRFNGSGQFNQSPDKRRLGRSPEVMRKHLLYTSFILKNKAVVSARDYPEVIAQAEPNDLVYMDPPYQGTSTSRNPRYHQGIDLEEIIKELEICTNGTFLIFSSALMGDLAIKNMEKHCLSAQPCTRRYRIWERSAQSTPYWR